MKRRIKRCILWFNLGQLEQMESWFTDMSSKGWHLIRINKHFASFVKDDTERYDYRIDVFDPNDDISADRKEMYHRCGWLFITSLDMIHIFVSKRNAERKEIYTDPTEQIASILKLKKQTNSVRNSLGFLLLFIIAQQIFMFNIDRAGYFLNMVSQGMTITILPLFITILYAISANILSLSTMIRRMGQGQAFEHHRKYKLALVLSKTIHLTTITLSVTALVIMISSINFDPSSQEKPIPMTELPVLSLVDVFPDEQITYEERNALNHGYKDNYIVNSSSLLVPKQFELREGFEIPGVTWGDGSGTYSPSIDSYKYTALTPWVARQLYNVILDEEKQDEHTAFTYDASRALSDVFDEIWTFEDKRDQSDIIIIGLKENDVYHVHLFSMEPAERIIELLEQKARAAE